MRGAQFKTVRTPTVRRNKMDMRNEKRLTCDPFFLYPVMLEKVLPGDKWNIGNEMVIRMNPLVSPMMHEINAYVHYFFVPFRLLWDDWEDFITGGRDGKFTAELPRWTRQEYGVTFDASPGSLWDYFFGQTLLPNQDCIKWPEKWPLLAYNFIWNEYYRDQNILEEIPLDELKVEPMGQGLRKRAWSKDYFTSLLPWQQRGDAPALPISGVVSMLLPSQLPNVASGQASFFGAFRETVSGNPQYALQGVGTNAQEATDYANAVRSFLTSMKVDLSNASTFDVSDLRLAFQIQKFLERNARAGSRYVEFLKAHWPAWPRDDRLDRPEYIGGSKTPIVVSEVLQTSSTDTTSPQGNMAGHGISADRTFCGSYRVQEDGLIMGLLSFLPKSLYSQGIDRQWLMDNRYDWPFPEFSALSEQAVFTEELYNVAPAPQDTVIGYQGRHDEFRFRRNMVHGLFHTDFQHWHMGRVFDTPPQLNESLVYPTNDEIQAIKRVMAVPTEPMFLVAFGNNNTAIRPMPWIAEPGLIDHF